VPRKVVTQRISNVKVTDNNTIVEEGEEKNMESENYMNSLDIITMSLDSEELGNVHFNSDEEILKLLKKWMKKYEELITKINTFFETKKTLFETEFSNLINVLNEKIENVFIS